MRSKQFYVSNDVYRAFWLLSRLNNASPGAPGFKISTPDEIADKVLRKYIEDNYSQLFDHQKAVDALEKKLIEELGPPRRPEEFTPEEYAKRVMGTHK